MPDAGVGGGVVIGATDTEMATDDAAVGDTETAVVDAAATDGETGGAAQATAAAFGSEAAAVG